MATEKVSAMPMIPASLLTDIIYEIQGGISYQARMDQVFNLMLANTILNFPGNPNGFIAGEVYQFCWDTTGAILFLCTTTGTAASAVWTVVSSSVPGIVSPANGGTGVSNPTAHTLPVAEGAANFNFLGPLTNGQLLIGSSGLDPVPATLTAGTNIGIVNAAGSITISATGLGGFTWNHVTTTPITMSPNNGYIIDDGGSIVTLTLPLTSAVGDEIDIIGQTTGLGWIIAQRVGQSIVFGTSTTTSGVGGSLASTNPTDSFYMICTVANTVWNLASGPQGNITVV